MNSSTSRGSSEFALKLLAYSWLVWFAIPFVFLAFAVFSHNGPAAAILNDSRFWAAFGISLASAFVVIILSLLFSIPLAYFLAYHEFKYKSVVEALLIDIPQTFPPVAVGVIYLFTLGPSSTFNLAFTFLAVVIAKLFVSAPFTLSYTLRKFREIRESKLDLVARSLGAGTPQVLFQVLVPLARQDIGAGLTLSWARAMGEFGGSLIFAGVIAYRTEVLPTYTSRVVGTDPFLALASTAVLTVFAILSIVAVRSFLKLRVK